MKDKRILILGAGRGQTGLYKAAKDLGIYTIAGTLPGENLPGLQYSDEVCFMNISNPEEVLNQAKKLSINGVATSCLDTGVTSLGKVCDSLNLIGLSEESAIYCQDKLEMKDAFLQHEVNTAKYKKVSSKIDLKNSLKELSLPVIIKATDLQGSKGIYIAHTLEEALVGFEKSLSETKRDYCIVEEFIEGIEFGAQAFIYNGEILFVMPHGDDVYMSHTAIPVGHYVPYNVNENIKKQTNEIVKKAIYALGLDNCAVNLDLIIKDNKVYIIELTGRVGANGLPELVSVNYDIDYYKMIVLSAIGENPMEIWNERKEETVASYAKMLHSDKAINEIKNIEYNLIDSNDLVDFSLFVKEGMGIKRFESSNDCIGQIIVKGKSVEECLETINNLESSIRFESI